MVDWDQVEKLRSKGWDWDRIAEEPRADFHADEAAGAPGRALRTLYYQRRSKRQRRTGSAGKGKEDEEPLSARWSLARIGYIVTPVFGVWFVLALAFPSPVGTYLPAVPTLGLFLAISAFVLVFGLLRATDKWTPVFRSSTVIGVILGFVVAGGFGLAAVTQGCPTLTPNTSIEPQGWVKAANGEWAVNQAPVFFFFGSAACPFCSASSWAMVAALERFGSLSGTYYDHSSSTDVYPNTPEVVLAGATLQSQYVALVVGESTDNSHVTTPGLASCVQQAYVSAYDASGIPFVVIAGQYIHSGTLVSPAALQGLSATQVQGQVSNQSGTAWNAIAPAAYLLEAFIVKANSGQPTSVANDPNVSGLLAQIH